MKNRKTTTPIRIHKLDARSFDVVPDTGADMTNAVRTMLASGFERGTEITLSPGVYVFRHHPEDEVTVAFPIRKLSGITVNGAGSTFLCHGYVMPFKVEDSDDVVIENVTVDWERPYITQGTVEACTPCHVNLKIDAGQYPYQIVNAQFLGVGPDWGAPRPLSTCYHNAYDAVTHEIPSGIRDNPLSLGPDTPAEELSPGRVRFHTHPEVEMPAGTFITLNHGRYIVKGIDIWRSRDVAVKNVTLYHVLSGGVVAARTENIDIDGLRIVPNEARGRVFSGVADGIHLIHCRGTVNVSNVEMAGHGDDFLNIHGRNSVMTEKLTPRQALVVRADCWDAGDEVWVVRQGDVQRREVLHVKSIGRINPRHELAKSETQLNNGIGLGWGLSTDKQGEWHVEFAEDIPEDMADGDVFENKTWNPERFTLRHCRILRRHRARGVLVSVPGQVIIEDNYFATAGAPILIEGDTSHWFESGGTEDVLIRNNLFDNCLSSGAHTEERWQWGAAIFTITPSHQPENADSPPYHRNIRIENNRIYAFDTPLVRAYSVGGLRFQSNTIVRTDAYVPFAFQKEAFWFDGCREVTIDGNQFENGFDGSTLRQGHMWQSDLYIMKTERDE